MFLFMPLAFVALTAVSCGETEGDEVTDENTPDTDTTIQMVEDTTTLVIDEPEVDSLVEDVIEEPVEETSEEIE